MSARVLIVSQPSALGVALLAHSLQALNQTVWWCCSFPDTMPYHCWERVVAPLSRAELPKAGLWRWEPRVGSQPQGDWPGDWDTIWLLVALDRDRLRDSMRHLTELARRYPTEHRYWHQESAPELPALLQLRSAREAFPWHCHAGPSGDLTPLLLAGSVANRFRPVLDVIEPERQPDYLEAAWDLLVGCRDSRTLPHLVDALAARGLPGLERQPSTRQLLAWRLRLEDLGAVVWVAVRSGDPDLPELLRSGLAPWAEQLAELAWRQAAPGARQVVVSLQEDGRFTLVVAQDWTAGTPERAWNAPPELTRSGSGCYKHTAQSLEDHLAMACEVLRCLDPELLNSSNPALAQVLAAPCPLRVALRETALALDSLRSCYHDLVNALEFEAEDLGGWAPALEGRAGELEEMTRRSQALGARLARHRLAWEALLAPEDMTLGRLLEALRTPPRDLTAARVICRNLQEAFSWEAFEAFLTRELAGLEVRFVHPPWSSLGLLLLPAEWVAFPARTWAQNARKHALREGPPRPVRLEVRPGEPGWVELAFRDTGFREVRQDLDLSREGSTGLPELRRYTQARGLRLSWRSPFHPEANPLRHGVLAPGQAWANPALEPYRPRAAWDEPDLIVEETPGVSGPWSLTPQSLDVLERIRGLEWVLQLPVAETSNEVAGR